MSTVLVVKIEVELAHIDEFLEILRAHGANSMAIEEGCTGFDIYVSQDEPNNLVLVEKYVDNDALQLHWESDHMQAYRDKVKGMIVSRESTKCSG